jgi:DNA-3-methyladenine glycosylase I
MTAAARPRRRRPAGKHRCRWVGDDALVIRYHDREWGVPLHADRRLFECLTLEGAQAGLSWSTILKKRTAYRRAFAGFDPGTVARFTPARIRRLLGDPGIVRHRGKIEATVANARAFLAVQREFGRFDSYIWRFSSAEEMSRDLQRRGFRFVGPAICQAFMQAVGLRNDHEPRCFRRRRRGAIRPAVRSGTLGSD